MPEFDDDETGRLIARLSSEPADSSAPVTQGQLSDIKQAVARFLVMHAKREAAEQDRREQDEARDKAARRREIYIGGAVTFGFAALMAFAVWGLGYVQQAAADHDGLARNNAHDAEQDTAIAALTERQATAFESLRAEQRATTDDLMRRGYELQSLVSRLEASVARLEGIDRDRRH